MSIATRRITTIITAFNHKNFIAEAINSALNQTGNFRHTILISDDASPDGTREIVRQYAKEHPSVIKDISPDGNLGISGNLRRAFAHVEDDWVAILEGDDYWTDEKKLEKQLRFLEERTDCSMVFSRVRIRDGKSYTLLDRHNGLPDKLGVNSLCNHHSCNLICNFSCCLFKTKLLKNLPEAAFDGRLSEVTVALFMVKYGWVGYIDECLSDYRFHQNNVFHSADRQSQEEQEEQTFLTACKVADESVVPLLVRKVDEARRNQPLLRVNSGEGLAFSIVTICRNDLAGLRKTAASVLAQTSDRYEWIVIDGGSSDGSAEYIKTELARHVSYWRSEPDDGIYDALNWGTLHAKGEYVIAMNSGDTFASPDVLHDCLTHEFKADVVYGDWIRCYPDREEERQAPRQLEPFHFIRLNLPNISHQAMFVRTRLLKDSPYDVRYKIVADYAKWRQFMMEGRSFQYIPVTVCRFLTGGASDTRALANEMDAARLRSQNAEWGAAEILRVVQSVDDLRDAYSIKKRLKSVAKQLLPWGVMRVWIESKYGARIDAPRVPDETMLQKVKRIIKCMLPFGLVQAYAKLKQAKSQ